MGLQVVDPLGFAPRGKISSCSCVCGELLDLSSQRRNPRILENLILEYTYWNEESLIELLKKHCVFERNLFKFPSNLKMESDLYILNTRTEYGWWLLENFDDQEHIRASGPTFRFVCCQGILKTRA